MTPLGGFVLGIIVTIIVEVIAYFWVVTHLFPEKDLWATFGPRKKD